jgi:hypothetical protein
MRRFTSVLAIALIHAFATMSSASLIVKNDPATDLSFRIGGPNSQAEGVVWAQVATTNTSISALIGSIDGSPETVDAYLSETVQGNVIASTTVTVGSFASSADFTSVNLFSGLSLDNAYYLLTLYNTDTSGDVNVRWSVGGSTTVTSHGVFYVSVYSDTPDTNVSAPYNSIFTTSGSPLGFEVTGVVPEPSTFALSLCSLVLLGVGRRFQRKA